MQTAQLTSPFVLSLSSWFLLSFYFLEILQVIKSIQRGGRVSKWKIGIKYEEFMYGFIIKLKKYLIWLFES